MGPIALRNVAQKSIQFSASMAETRGRVLSLHRDVLRSVPWIKRAFYLPLSEQVCSALGRLFSEIAMHHRQELDHIACHQYIPPPAPFLPVPPACPLCAPVRVQAAFAAPRLCPTPTRPHQRLALIPALRQCAHW